MRQRHASAMIVGLIVGLWVCQGIELPAAWADSHEEMSTTSVKLERLLEQLGNLFLGLGLTGVVQGTVNNGSNNAVITPEATRHKTPSRWSEDAYR
jgi:hypothetical protein